MTGEKTKSLKTLTRALAMIALLLPGLLVAPAHATEIAGGVVAFSGNATLPLFPCPTPEPGELPCQGTWQGTITADFDGNKTTAAGQEIPWNVVINTPAKAHISYADVVQGGLCAQSAARVTFTFSGGPNQALGAYANSSLVPAAIFGAEGQMELTIRREGATSVVLLAGLRLDVYVGLLGWVRVIESDQTIGVADPLGSFAPGESVLCNPQDPQAVEIPLDGKLVGIAVQAL